MSSKILVDELAGKTATGNITVTGEGGTGTMQLQQGLLKAWVNYDNNTSLAVEDSLNVSSGTDEDLGNTSIALTNSFSNANFCQTMGTGDNGRVWSVGHALATTDTSSRKTTSGTWLHTTNGTAGTAGDLDENNIMMSGDLA